MLTEWNVGLVLNALPSTVTNVLSRIAFTETTLVTKLTASATIATPGSIINLGLLMWTAIMCMACKGFIQRVHGKMFALPPETINSMLDDGKIEDAVATLIKEIELNPAHEAARVMLLILAT